MLYNINKLLGKGVEQLEIPQEYSEVLEALGAVYEEVDGCSFYRYIFPDNQRQGEHKQGGRFEKPNAVFLYKDDRDEGKKRRLRRRIMLSDT